MMPLNCTLTKWLKWSQKGPFLSHARTQMGHRLSLGGPTLASRPTQLLRQGALRHPLGEGSCSRSPMTAIPPSSSVQLCPAIKGPHNQGRGCLAHALTRRGPPGSAHLHRLPRRCRSLPFVLPQPPHRQGQSGPHPRGGDDSLVPLHDLWRLTRCSAPLDTARRSTAAC